MELSDISDRGLVLLGCGKMGTALLEGWLARGLAPRAVTVLEPGPSPRLEELIDDDPVRHPGRSPRRLNRACATA